MAQVPIEQLLYGIRSTESGGLKEPYKVVNSIGATGAYQVMRQYIAEWTKEALGRSYTQAEFIADPAAQDKTAAFRLGRDMKKYDSWESAAAVWFSGQPNPNSSASDGGSTVRQYVNDVGAAMAKWKPGATVPTGTAEGGVQQAGLTDGLTGIFTVMGQGINSMATSMLSFSTLATWLMKLALPTTWVRIACGLFGLAFLLIGLITLGREVKGS